MSPFFSVPLKLEVSLVYFEFSTGANFLKEYALMVLPLFFFYREHTRVPGYEASSLHLLCQ